MPIQAGTRLGAYEVIKPIGRGAMGTVFLARHEDLDRTAAVKVMLAYSEDAIGSAASGAKGRPSHRYDIPTSSPSTTTARTRGRLLPAPTRPRPARR